jgi:peptidoglycan/xylan/chitin deacetylase (PgdA/CDA1 family)
MEKLNTIPVLAYHKVDRRFEWGVTRLYPSQFRLQMEFLHAKGFKGVTLSGAEGGNKPEKAVVITFDDAYRGLMDYAVGVMERYSFRATVFVVTDYVGKYNLWDVNIGYRKFLHMDWGDLRAMVKRGFEIGSHSHTHPDLTKLPGSGIEKELSESKRILEERLGVRIKYISYPFGRYSPAVKKIAEACGYEGGVCLSHPFKDHDDDFEIERMSVYNFDTMMDFRAKLFLYGKGGVFAEKAKGRIVNFFAGATHPLKRLEIALSGR